MHMAVMDAIYKIHVCKKVTNCTLENRMRGHYAEERTICRSKVKLLETFAFPLYNTLTNNTSAESQTNMRHVALFMFYLFKFVFSLEKFSRCLWSVYYICREGKGAKPYSVSATHQNDAMYVLLCFEI